MLLLQEDDATCLLVLQTICRSPGRQHALQTTLRVPHTAMNHRRGPRFALQSDEMKHELKACLRKTKSGIVALILRHKRSGLMVAAAVAAHAHAHPLYCT